jgi:hypothetical protein
MEESFKRDVIREVLAGSGRILLHDEVEERLNVPSTVATPFSSSEEWTWFITSGELHLALKNELADRGCIISIAERRRTCTPCHSCQRARIYTLLYLHWYPYDLFIFRLLSHPGYP